ncbi:hypothetical protein P4O66_004708 [Electrophorus voltai]|uniref:Doublesex- and mab-3-related transcription factor A2 n=1 Tax=Electrophorus voltai TaxID=2609070 RepID=A0AAD8ZKU3_9TELE|nr:hypothetical protein P4O66_004708 [Electrophorus voltai]
MAAQVALRRQQAQEENEARELQLLYGTAEGLALAAANGIIPPRQNYEVFGPVSNDTNSDSNIQKFELFPKTPLPGSVTPQPAVGKSVSTDTESVPGISSPEVRHGSGSENGDGESFVNSPVTKPVKDGEETPPSISPLGSDSDTDKEEQEPSPSPASSRQMNAIDILTRVFPTHKRSVLELVLQGCGKDVVQAIEQILNNSGQARPPEDSWTAERMLQGAQPPMSSTPRPVHPGSMTLSNRSAFSPLQPNGPHFGADPSTYPLSTHLGLNPLRLAYSAHSRGLAFMTPYSTTGLMPTLGFRPPMDYAFSDLIRDRTLLHKDQSYTNGLYGPLVNNTPEKQLICDKNLRQMRQDQREFLPAAETSAKSRRGGAAVLAARQPLDTGWQPCPMNARRASLSRSHTPTALIRVGDKVKCSTAARPPDLRLRPPSPAPGLQATKLPPPRLPRPGHSSMELMGLCSKAGVERDERRIKRGSEKDTTEQECQSSGIWRAKVKFDCKHRASIGLDEEGCGRVWSVSSVHGIGRGLWAWRGV